MVGKKKVGKSTHLVTVWDKEKKAYKRVRRSVNWGGGIIKSHKRSK